MKETLLEKELYLALLNASAITLTLLERDLEGKERKILKLRLSEAARDLARNVQDLNERKIGQIQSIIWDTVAWCNSKDDPSSGFTWEEALEDESNMGELVPRTVTASRLILNLLAE